MNDHKQSTSECPEFAGLEVLCDFHLGGHECWLVANNDGDSMPGSAAGYVALCHFRVDDRALAIIQKTRRTENSRAGDQLSLLLTARELQIATLVAMGCPNKQVARKLHISEWTVATYLRRIYAKLGVDSRAAMTFRCASLIGKQKLVVPELGGRMP